jgi:uncharacterized membrane protein
MLAAILTLALTAAPNRPQEAARTGAADPVHVREIFTTKCTQCHGSTLPHPKGKFGFITNLRRLASDPDYVVPGDPDGSYLWNQIDDGEMPPKKAKAGPLTPEEKQAIQDWIKDGAPAPPDDPAASEPGEEQGARGGDAGRRGTSESPQDSRSKLDRMGALAGKFHVLTIHFPIALLAAAALGELWGSLRRRIAPLPAVRYCLWLGAIAAFVSAGLGWLHAHYMDEEPETLLTLHRWIGTAAGVFAPGVAWLSERDARAGVRRAWVRWGIVALGVLVGVAGHFGGLLVYGEHFLSF